MSYSILGQGPSADSNRSCLSHVHICEPNSEVSGGVRESLPPGSNGRRMGQASSSSEENLVLLPKGEGMDAGQL